MISEDCGFLACGLPFFEMVPKRLHGKAPRTFLSKLSWKMIREHVLDRAEGKCEICGTSLGRLEAHERYAMSGNALVLKRIMSVCRACHMIAHPGFAAVKGGLSAVLTDYAVRHHIPPALAENEFRQAMRRWEKLSQDIECLEFSMLGKFWTFLSEKDREAVKRHAFPFIPGEGHAMEPLAFIPDWRTRPGDIRPAWAAQQ